MNEIQTRLLRAVYVCMRPLARLLLRSGITYKSFAEVAKRAFVHEAILDKDPKGRATNSSRVAVRTGLSRKEVRRISTESMFSDKHRIEPMDHSGSPARVLVAWHTDSRFVDSSGTPRDLAIEGASPNFAELVRAVGGDVPPGAVRAELLRATAVTELENGLLRPAKRYFVPGDFDEKAITILSGILYPMISVVDHNANATRLAPGFIQRFAFGKLAGDRRTEFREWSRQESTKFIETIDDWLVSRKADAPGQETDGVISGVGVFFFEGPPAESVPIPDAKIDA
jgi:hypothetical protein